MENDREDYLVHVAGIDLKKLIVDYGAAVEDIFESLVDSIISATGSLNIICASQFPSSFTRSWVQIGRILGKGIAFYLQA